METDRLESTEISNLAACDLAMEVLKQFRLIIGSVRQHFREIEERCGISGSQMWILTEVQRAPGLGVSELAGRLAIHQSTGSLLVEKLVARELLIKQRSRQDQRRVGLYLTEAGQSLLSHLPGPAEGILPDALKALPQSVLANLNVNLGELVRHLHISEERYSATPLADIVAGGGNPTAREEESCRGR